MTYDRLQGRRREAARRPARRAQGRRAGLRACREPRHDLLDGQAAGRERATRRRSIHAISHPRGSRGRGLQPADRMRRADRPADHDLPRLDGRGRRDVIRRRAARGVKVFAETCPQYLFLTAHDLDKPGIEGAKWMCSPPPRDAGRPGGALAGAGARRPADRSRPITRPMPSTRPASSAAGPNPTFKQIANGLPGLEARLPLLFDAMVSKGRLGVAEVRRADRDGAGQDLQSAPAQGLDRHRRRRRHRAVGPRRARSRSPTR